MEGNTIIQPIQNELPGHFADRLGVAYANVSATELREISFPPLDTIKDIGNTIIQSNDFSVENTNRIVKEYFEPAYFV